MSAVRHCPFPLKTSTFSIEDSAKTLPYVMPDCPALQR